MAGRGFTRPLGLIGHLILEDANITICANSGLSFASVGGNAKFLLSAGNLISSKPGTTITSYTIEWKLNSINGNTVLITGVGDNPLLQEKHPFSNKPITAGKLYPVIKYITINGVEYSSIKEEGKLYSPDLIECLPFVIVEDLKCNNGNYVMQTYTHNINYLSDISSFANAEREFKFMLSSDTNFFQFIFRPENIADRIIIDYINPNNTSQNVNMVDIICGDNVIPENVVNKPYRISTQYPVPFYASILDLTSKLKGNGEYLNIHIIPRVDDPTNTNTNWYFGGSCLTSYSCYEPTSMTNVRKIDTSSVKMIFNESNCRFELTFNPVEDYFVKLSEVEKSHVVDHYVFDSMLNSDSGRDIYSLYIPNKITASDSGYNNNALKNTTPINVTKNNNVITIIFSKKEDYDDVKAKYNEVINSPDYLAYTTDGTKLEHYSTWRIDLFQADSIGDNINWRLFYGMHDSTFVFDDVQQKIVFTMVNNNDEYPSTTEACNTLKQRISSKIQWIKSSIEEIVPAYTTKIIKKGMLMYLHMVPYTDAPNETQKYFTFIKLNYPNNYPCLPTSVFNTAQQNYPNRATFNIFALYVKFTDTSSIEAKLNNFEIWNCMQPDGTYNLYDASKRVLIYKKQNGVVTVQ